MNDKNKGKMPNYHHGEKAGWLSSGAPIQGGRSGGSGGCLIALLLLPITVLAHPWKRRRG